MRKKERNMKRIQAKRKCREEVMLKIEAKEAKLIENRRESSKVEN